MKKYINMPFFLTLLVLLGSQFLLSCTEDDTLEGAKEVYITIHKKNPFILVGDTTILKGHVSNLSGDTIYTPIVWSIDDESIAVIKGDSLFAVDGAQGKSTKIRATISNGKYAVTNLTVSRHIANGVTAMKDVHYTYNMDLDTVWFAVSPKEYLCDYSPKIINSDPELAIPHEEPLYINKETGLVGYAFSSKNGYGKAMIKLTLNNGGDFSAETEIVVSPSIVSSLGTDFNLITYEKGMSIDINKTDTVWVCTKVDPNYEIDLANAEKAYKWSIEGNAAQMVDIGVKHVKDRGHDAYMVVRSGKFTGKTIVKFECNGTILTTTIDIQDYATQYPVDELKVDKTEIAIRMGKTAYVTPTVIPLSSFGMHQPVFTPVNPSIVKILGYNGNEMAIQAVEVGETDIIVTSNDKSLVIHMKVLENLNVVLRPGNQSHIFVGQTTQWFADVTSSSGEVYVPSWLVGDEDIAKVDADGNITGVNVGITSITAEADGVLSKPDDITVMAIPNEGIVYDNKNTDIDGNAAYVDDSKLIVRLSPIGAPFEFFELLITPNSPIYDVINTVYNNGNSDMMVVANGSSVSDVQGDVTISNGEESDMKTINANLTVTIGNNSFVVSLSNVSVWL